MDVILLIVEVGTHGQNMTLWIIIHSIQMADEEGMANGKN